MTNNHTQITKKWHYDFRQFLKIFDDEAIEKFLKINQPLYSEITKKWCDELHSEWICRLFLSSKMILSATLNINTLTFAEEKNLRCSSGYLEYQALQACLRSIAFISPLSKWDDGSLIIASHTSILKKVYEIISVFDAKLATKFEKYFLYLKTYNELISYSMPTGEIFSKEKPPDIDLVDLCELLCEVAQAQSELLEDAIAKNVTGGFEFLDYYIDQANRVEIDGHSFLNKNDWFRLGRIRRKELGISNIMFFLSEGYVEDFFDSWTPEENDFQENTELFNPDKNWNIIFDVP